MRKLLLPLIFTAVLLISVNVVGGEEMTFGKMWLTMSTENRHLYMAGFVDGQNSAQVFSIKPSDISIIAEIMVQYYRDSANTYIPWGIMTDIANTKLQGESEAVIERLLEEARKISRD